MIKAGDIVRLVKVVDGEEIDHSKDGRRSYPQVGTLLQGVKLGESVIVDNNHSLLMTTEVIKIIDENNFKTRSNFYRITLIECKHIEN